MKPTVRIRGAGFSGLVVARELLRAGFPVEIFERAERAGGLLGSERTPLCLRELGANAVLANAHVENFLAELGVELAEKQPAARRRLIWRRGRPRRWPLGLAGTLRLLAGMAPALWRGRKRIQPLAGESVAEWGRRVLGRAAAEQLLFPALQGIYAGDPAQLSANLVCASLLGPKPPRGRWRGSIAPRGGMGELIAKLCADVEARGGKIHLGSSAEPRPGEIWVKAGAPEQGPELLPVATVTLAFRAPRFDLRGFGCLFPRGEGFRALGVLSNHNIFAGRGRSETWLFGGALDRGVIALGDAELIALARAERQRLYGAHEPADEAHVVRWPRAIPHYTLAWEQRLTEIRQGPEVYEAGNHLGQLGLARLLEGNQRLAARIVSDHG